MSYQAFINSLPPPYEPKVGERVRLLRYDHCAAAGITHEVRLVPRPDQIEGFSIFFGSKKQCLQWMADNALECTNLAGWGERQLSAPQLFKGSA